MKWNYAKIWVNEIMECLQLSGGGLKRGDKRTWCSLSGDPTSTFWILFCDKVEGKSALLFLRNKKTVQGSCDGVINSVYISFYSFLCLSFVCMCCSYKHSFCLFFPLISFLCQCSLCEEGLKIVRNR